MYSRFTEVFYELLSQEPNALPKPPLGPLNGLPVVGIVEHIAGPAALGTLVADGAIGISIEPFSGDPARHYLSHECFTSFHAGKISLAMDLKKDENYLKILSHATVIIDNRSQRAREADRVLQNFLKDAAKLKRVIYCYITGFPGNDATRSGNDVTVQAASGLAYVNAPTQDQPLKVGTPLLDFAAADWAVIAIQGRLIQMLLGVPVANEKNKVIEIEVNLAAIAARLLCSQYLAVKKGESIQPRYWNQDNYVSVFSFFKTADNIYLSIATLSDQSFKQFAEQVLMRPDLSDRFPKNTERLKQNEYIHTEIRNCFSEQTASYWLEKLKAAKITHAVVETVPHAVNQSYSKYLFAETSDHTLMIARPDGHKPKLDPAPKLNQHAEIFRSWLRKAEEKNNEFELEQRVACILKSAL